MREHERKSLIKNGFVEDRVGWFSKKCSKYDIFIDYDGLTVYRKDDRDNPFLNKFKFENISQVFLVLNSFGIDDLFVDDKKTFNEWEYQVSLAQEKADKLNESI